MGAALLRKPTKLAKMVAGIAAAVDLPVTVKIRTGKQHLTCPAGALEVTYSNHCSSDNLVQWLHVHKIYMAQTWCSGGSHVACSVSAA
jgi:tRNA-dihydrouridine synthase